MDVLSHPFAELTTKLSAGERLSSADLDAVVGTPDLAGLGALGESARRTLAGEVVTFARVAEAPNGQVPPDLGQAGELRITGRPTDAAQATEWVRQAAAVAGRLPVTGFSAADLFELCGGDASRLTALCSELKASGLEAIAELPVDRTGSAAATVRLAGAIRASGLQMWRFVIERGPLATRRELMDIVAEVQAVTSAVRAFAPLPKHDQVESPSTGYDDVRTITLARVICRDVPAIQVDWKQYGPKLAQVAIAFGANDLDNVSPIDDPALGPRRAAGEDLKRQIRAAAAEPRERDGRFDVVRQAAEP